MITRARLNKAIKKAKLWFENEEKKGKDSNVYQAVKSHLRGEDFKIYYDEAIYKLDHINFYYEDDLQNWGETDGLSLSLNSYHEWDDEALEKTLIHEALHFIIQRQGIHEISEYKEHNIMRSIDSELVDY